MQNEQFIPPQSNATDLRDELGRQYRILMKEAPVRLATTSAAYGLSVLVHRTVSRSSRELRPARFDGVNIGQRPAGVNRKGETH